MSITLLKEFAFGFIFCFNCTKFYQNFKIQISFWFYYGEVWPDFSEKLECEIWIMFLHEYKLRLLYGPQRLRIPWCSSLLFFSVLLLLAIMLMQYLCTWGLHIKYSKFKPNYLLEKARVFCLFFYCKVMQISSFSA